MTVTLEGWPTKATEAPSPHVHQPRISKSQEITYNKKKLYSNR